MIKYTKLSQFDEHDHVVVLDYENGIGTSSEDEGHSHPVIWQQAVVDPATGAEITPGYWLVAAAEDGHTHDILPEYEKKYTKQDEEEQTEDQIIGEVARLWADVEAQTKESYDNLEKAENFYYGDQWEESVKAELNSSGKACLTINKIETAIDELCGLQRQNRADFHYLPQEDTDQRKCDILNTIAKEICSFSNFQQKESEVFLDTCIGGLGFYDIEVDFSENVEGDILIKRFPVERARMGIHQESDGSDREIDFKYEWLSYSSARARFPHKREEIGHYWNLVESGAERNISIAGLPDAYKHGVKQNDLNLASSRFCSLTRREVLLLECLRKEYFYAPAVIYEPTGDVFEAEGWTRADVERLEKIEGLQIVERYKPKIRKTVLCGGVLVYDKSPANMPGNTFSLTPVYGKRRRHKFWGKVKPAIDPQRELNKRTSQTIDIVNRMMSDLTYFDEQMFPTEHDMNGFVQNSSTPGYMQKLVDVSKRPVRETGVAFPNEIAQLIQFADAQIQSIMNIKAQPTNTSVEGALLTHQLRMMLAGNEFLFDNLIAAKKRIAKLLIHYIQQYYTPKRVVRLLRKAGSRPGGDVMIGGQPISQYTDEEIQELFETTDLNRYDVEVAEHAFSATMRAATLLTLKELAQQGQAIPFPVIVEYMDMPQEAKDKILMAYQQQQQAAAQQQQLTVEMETTKTALAQNIMPPKFKYQLEQQAKEVEQMKAQEAMAQQGQTQIPGILK